MNIMSLGVFTIKIGSCRVQLYYPKFTLRLGNQSEIFLDLGSNLRFVVDKREGIYVGLGFELLGFGIAFDYYKKWSAVNKY